VAEHLNTADSLAAGLRALPGASKAFASTQAAWRFYGNERITYEQLGAPLLKNGREAAAECAVNYALIAHDWSHLDYSEHNSKRDRTLLHNKTVFGYELQTALLISDRTGEPLSVICQSLLAADGLHTTCRAEVMPEISQLDELSEAIRFVDGCGLGKPSVHIVDRECDSVWHYRHWQQEDRLFVVRAKNRRIVKHDGQDKSLCDVVSELDEQKLFRFSQEVEFRGQAAKQYVAETTVVIDRPAKPQRTKHRNGGGRRVPGEAIELRLVVSRITDTDGELLSEWWLWTNVPGVDQSLGVSAEQVAQWYYWRWRIETFFKLLKSAGHNVEQWQQESVEAVAKRLLVATMACVVVWQLARSKDPGADEFRQFLVRLSGRQMKWGRSFTEPALLAGLGMLLAMLDVIEQYDVEEIKRLAWVFLPGHYRMNM
jgi:hypothetical protein